MPRYGDDNYRAAAAKSSSSSFPLLIIIVVLFGLFYVTIIRPQRNRQRNAQRPRGRSARQRVRTTAGIYGTVISGDDRDVVVEIGRACRSPCSARIMEVVPDEDATAEPARRRRRAGPGGASAGELQATDLSADGPVTSSQNGAAANGTAPGTAADHTVTGEHPAD